ncbi:MAG: zinc-binding dehydrogenase [Burkholderiales bacterium]|nr:zinc-binding dehydrogenase [Burkholderiales bacterium]
MKAWVIEKSGDAARMVWQEVPDLKPGEGELLVRTRAVGLNRADLMLNAGHYARIATRPPQPIAGLEAAGEIIGMGDKVTGWKIGDRVMGMPSGAYAEQVLIQHRLAVPVPASLAWSAAAALPVALFTAHDAIVTNARHRAGESVFVQAASSGVGLAAVQIARARGANVIAGTASRAKLERLAGYGLTHGIDYAQGAAAPTVMRATGDRGADVIVDMVGASAIDDHLALAAVGARWVQIGRMGGNSGAVNLNELSRKRISLIGVTFRTRDVSEFAAVVESAWRDFGAAIAAGRFAMPVEKVFALAEADRAQATMRENRHFGKFILET